MTAQVIDGQCSSCPPALQGSGHWRLGATSVSRLPE